MNFGQIYGEVGNLTPSTSVARDKQFVNEAYQDINSRRRWSWLQSSTTVPLVTGQRGYTVLGTTPVVTDFDSPIAVVLEITASGSRRELARMDPQTFEDVTGSCFVNSVPMFWTIHGATAATTSATVVQGGQQQISLSPPPTAAVGQGVNIIIRYWRSAASIEMTADADVPIIPAQYHRMIVQRACAIAMRRYAMTSDAVSFEQDFQEQLAAAIEADQLMYSGDNRTLAFKTLPQLDERVPQSAPTYNLQTRPLPQPV